MNIKAKIKNNWHIGAVIILAIAFFAGTSLYNAEVRSPGFMKWGSPDENANYVFTKKYGQTGDIRIFEKYNLYADDIIHPRSVRSDHGQLKPVSFLGIILIFGTFVKWFGYEVIPFLTPFFAGLGIIFFYLLIKRIFGRRNALMSSFLMAFFPVYVYYTARSMFHNVLFVSLLIMALYFLVLMARPERKEKKFATFRLYKSQWLNMLGAAIGGGLAGLALAARTSEALWVLPLFLLLWVFNIKKVGFTKLVIAVSFCFLALLPVAYWNQILYGSPLSGGYPEMNQSIHTLTRSGGSLVSSAISGEMSLAGKVVNKIKDTIFYFGFDPIKSWQAFKDYFIKMFPGIFVAGGLGLILFFQGLFQRKKKFWVYLLAYFVVSMILVLYYGSWQFHDNPDATSITIGNSYTRYWLPVYLGMLPFVSFFVIRFSRGLFSPDKKHFHLYRKIKGEKLQEIFNNFLKKEKLWGLRAKFLINGIRVVAVSIFIFFFVGFTLYGSEEGLIYTLSDHKASQAVFQNVLDNTRGNGVIVTQYHDKMLFPQRKVVYGLFDDLGMVERYSRIAEHLPVYYFNFSLPKDAVQYLNSSRLPEFGLQIRKKTDITTELTLYRLFLQKD